ncbi:MAG: lmo0937 family membrane protein [Candidatus Acidiferrales bacterium]
MLWVLWRLGMLTSYTLGGFIDILLLMAVAIFVINLIQGQRWLV